MTQSTQANVQCSADPSVSQKTDYSQVGPLQPATLDITFVDKSRPTPATAGQPGAPSRTLVTTIYYPSSSPAPLFGSAPLAKGGPFPLLMYSHGYSSDRGEASRVANRLASYGYIIVAPDFPLTSLSNLFTSSSGPDLADVVNQPGDQSFLIDQVLALSHNKKHVLAGGVDEARIGALGVSLGGMTTLLVSLHPTLQDPRIKVAMPIAPVSYVFLEGFYHTRDLPLLLVSGDLDAIVDYPTNARRSFTDAVPDARLVTIAKGTHSAFGAVFPSALLPLLNAVVAPPGANPNNPDGLGCGEVGAALVAAGSGWFQGLGGASDFIDPNAGAMTSCTGNQYKQAAIDPDEQEDIVLRAAVPFFDAYFGTSAAQRQDGCRYLNYELPKHPSVTLE